MKFLTQNKNILLFVLVSLTLVNIALCGWKYTKKQSFQSGNVMALTSHFLGCPNKHGITHWQPQKSGNRFWFKYKCYGACAGQKRMKKSYWGTTKWNATDRNKKRSLHYLDRHHVQCKNGYALQSFGLKRSGNRIQYKYKCAETRCKKRSFYYGKPANTGSNQTRYYPRFLVKIPKSHHVITGFHYQRTRGTTFRYKTYYCELNHKFPKKKKAPKKKPAKKPAKKPVPKVSPLPAGPAGPAPGPHKDDIPTVAALTPAANLAVAKGSKFCAKHCVVNMARRTRQCLLGNKAYDCKRCVINPTKNNAMINSICETVCDSVGFKKPCEFFGYYNGAKKNVNGAALKKYGLALIRRR